MSINKELDYYKLEAWLEKHLNSSMQEDINAFNFNLYEEATEDYGVQLIGTNEFDENDDDWACTDYFTTGEDILLISRVEEIEDWENGLNYIKSLIDDYLNRGEFRERLLSVNAVGVGFVDGDAEIIYKK